MEDDHSAAVIVKIKNWPCKISTYTLQQNDPTAHARVVAIHEAYKLLNSFQLDG